MAFLKTGIKRFKRVGKNRKKKQIWRRPRGRHNKIRERRKNRPIRVDVGYKKNTEKKLITIQNMKQAESVNKGQKVNLGKFSKKKRKDIIKKLVEKNVTILNLRKKQIEEMLK